MSRFFAALSVLVLLCSLVGCTDKPVKQGMVTADGLTFLCETVSDEKAGTVAVTVTVTNGKATDLYLAAPELEGTDGKQTAAYLDMTLDLAPAEVSSIEASQSDLDTMTETGLTRKLFFAARSSYEETRVFTAALPATLTVTVSQAPHYDAEPTATTVTLPLKSER